MMVMMSTTTFMIMVMVMMMSTTFMFVIVFMMVMSATSMFMIMFVMIMSTTFMVMIVFMMMIMSTTSMVMIMFVMVVVIMMVVMAALMLVAVLVRMLVRIAVHTVAAAKPHMHLHALNAVSLLGLALQTKFVFQPKLGKLCLQVVCADPKINHGGKVHVAADSGKTVVVENFHITPVTRYCWQIASYGRRCCSVHLLSAWQYRGFGLHKE